MKAFSISCVVMMPDRCPDQTVILVVLSKSGAKNGKPRMWS